MSRSRYTDDCDGNEFHLYRGVVASAIRGKRGQTFLKELLKALDEMPEKRLIAHELISETGEVCAIGAVCKAKGIDVKDVEVECPEDVGALVNIAYQMAAEIAYENDEGSYGGSEKPEARWVRMRKWVEGKIKK